MNWTDCILDIEGCGLSLSAIARELNCPITTLSDIKQGRTKEPRGSLAIALLRLHADRVAAPKREQKEAA